MQETKRMADEANRLGQQAQEQMQGGFEAASRSFTEANKGFPALAAEMMEYSKAPFDEALRTCEQLIGVRSLERGLGALLMASYEITGEHCAAYDLAIKAMRPLQGTATLVKVNDVRGHAAVLALFDEVIA